MRIDAHQHFWDIARGDYSWMDDSVARIRRDIGPEDIRPHLRAAGIQATVVVQAAPTVAETLYLLSLADAHEFIRAVVGWIDLAADAAPQLDRLTHERLKGVRPMLQDIAETEWVLRDDVLAGVRAVASAGLRLDALITPRHLPVIDRLARDVPDLPIVIDHCAKPAFRGTDPGDDWRAGLTALAAHEQVFCKLSGLANEYGAGWSADTLRPVFDHVLARFGPERLMWGSDWPVLELAGDYGRWIEVADTLTADLSEHERAMIFGGTARRFYAL